ncbi:MAG: response regulator [Anaerolineales bacterium]
MSQLILVVDDEPKIVRLARDYLVKHGFRVVTAGDGQAALAAARREKPDLIVLDLMLPKLDGSEVCRILRRESDVPIIMLTALAEEIDQVTGLEIGADDYVTKPFSPRALVARVRALLRRARRDSPAEVDPCGRIGNRFREVQRDVQWGANQAHSQRIQIAAAARQPSRADPQPGPIAG